MQVVDLPEKEKRKLFMLHKLWFIYIFKNNSSPPFFRVFLLLCINLKTQKKKIQGSAQFGIKTINAKSEMQKCTLFNNTNYYCSK